MNGIFVWYELMTRDPKAAIAFYSEVAGWTTQPFGEGDDYTMWVGSQGPLGGVMAISDEVAKAGGRPQWTAHVQVADVAATARLAAKLGGKAWKEPTEIPTVGRFAVLGDPQDAVLAVFQPNAPMTLHDASKDGEFCWHELVTTDPTAAFRFYAELFGWQVVEDMDMGPSGTYRVFGLGERRLGGVMPTPRATPMPSMWLYYVSTSDLDAALGRAKKKGGKVLNGPMDIPGGGRIAQLADREGVAFALHQAPKG